MHAFERRWYFQVFPLYFMICQSLSNVSIDTYFPFINLKMISLFFSVQPLRIRIRVSKLSVKDSTSPDATLTTDFQCPPPQIDDIRSNPSSMVCCQIRVNKFILN